MGLPGFEAEEGEALAGVYTRDGAGEEGGEGEDGLEKSVSFEGFVGE